MLRSRPVDWNNPFTVPFGAVRPALVALDAKREETVLPAIVPSVKTIMHYRRELKLLIYSMHQEVEELVRNLYARHEPVIAMDAKPLPADKFQYELDILIAKWNRQFKSRGEELADWLAKKISSTGDLRLASALKRKGITIKFKLTKQQRDVMQAIVNENVQLIKSIPQEYLGKVQGAVMRSIAHGGDREQLVRDIKKIYNVTDKRAELISRDQSRKATNALQRSRQLELGVTEAIWMHSSASKSPRITHVKNNGKKYKIKEGWYDPAVKRYIMPGELINCHCSSRPILPGL